MQFDGETVKWAASLGVGGILAAVMFLIHRKDMQTWNEHLRSERDSAREQTNILLTIVKENSTALAMNTAATRSNTEMLAIMKTDLLDSFARAGSLDRRSNDFPIDPENDRRRR